MWSAAWQVYDRAFDRGRSLRSAAAGLRDAETRGDPDVVRVLAGEPALVGGDHRTAFAAYESRISAFAKGCQKTSGNAGPFLAPATERRIRSRDRMYRLLASRPLTALFQRLTERSATNIRLPEYPKPRGHAG